jgi:predicted PurR-regulated permease PerM
MRKLLLLLILFISVEGLAQGGDTIFSSTDSTLIKLQKFQDSVLTSLPPVDSNAIKENFDRNINSLLEVQKNRRAKEKRGAMIRIGIGVAFLIVLIIGLRKKATKK